MTGPEGDVRAVCSRADTGRLVAALTRWLGADRLDLAMDAVQDALAAALRAWPHQGVPLDPAGWLYRVARNRALDELRRSCPEPIAEEHLEVPGENAEPSGILTLVPDQELALVLLCCHPALTPETAVVLTLKVATGFSTKEIARVLLVDPVAVEQRIVRAKQRVRQGGKDLAVPAADLPRRLSIAHDVLYAMFTEGYASATVESGLRRELCGEALRLAELTTQADTPSRPYGHALAALFCFHAARLSERIAEDGSLLLLCDQDRSRWDRRLIGRGQAHLGQAAQAPHLSRFHVEAEIASCHAVAASYPDTEWARIEELYEVLQRHWPSPMVTLNRAIATAELRGPQAGLALLDQVEMALGDQSTYHAARAELELRLGNRAAARTHFGRALALATAAPVRRFLAGRLVASGSDPNVDFGLPRPS